MYTQTLAIIFDHIQQPQWLLITVDQAWKKISWKTNQAEFLLSISLLKKILLKNLAVCKPAFHSGAPRAKRASGTPWVNKTTHPRKFGNHVTDRPSVRTTGVPMFTLTLSSYFGSPGESWLHINVVVNWQLSKQGIRWPVSPDRIADSGVDQSRSSIFWSYPLTIYSFSKDRRLRFFFKFIPNMLCLCHYRPALLRFWFQTDLRRKN